MTSVDSLGSEERWVVTGITAIHSNPPDRVASYTVPIILDPNSVLQRLFFLLLHPPPPVFSSPLGAKKPGLPVYSLVSFILTPP